jgi:hypothetical protein
VCHHQGKAEEGTQHHIHALLDRAIKLMWVKDLHISLMKKLPHFMPRRLKISVRTRPDIQVLIWTFFVKLCFQAVTGNHSQCNIHSKQVVFLISRFFLIF